MQRYCLRRPSSLEDFRRLETNQGRYLFGTRLDRFFQVANLRRSPHDAPSNLPFYAGFRGRGRRINPLAKTWAFFIIEEPNGRIAGVYTAAGLEAATMERLLHEDSDEIPLDDLSWEELYVPDPARQDRTRFAFSCSLTDWNNPAKADAMRSIAHKAGDLFQVDTLFTQTLNPARGHDHGWVPESLGYRRIRASRSKTEEATEVTIWVWERDSPKARLHKPGFPELEAGYSEVAALTAFYQELTSAEREVLVYLIHNYGAEATSDRLCLHIKTVEARRSRLKRALEIEAARRGEEGLRRLGIEGDPEDGKDLGTLFRQSRVSQALKRIAWFYGELPRDL